MKRQIRIEQIGSALRAFEITALSQTFYEEKEVEESPILTPHAAWNQTGMHHADPHLLEDGTWIAAVDGYVYLE